MNRKPLSKKGSVAGIKTMETDWTVLQDTFKSVADIIAGELLRGFNKLTGSATKPPRDRFPYV